MKTCLVSLVSDQTIPNIVVVEQFKPDHLLMISTEKMEKKGKSQAILDTLKLRGLDYSNSNHVIEVMEDSIIDLQTRGTQWISESPHEFDFIVNLTGGTKLMSIAAFDVFTGFGSRMVYVPIGRNQYLAPFPKRRPRPPEPLDLRLSVEEYLTAYGIRITNSGKLPDLKKSAEERSPLTCRLFEHYREFYPFLKLMGDRFRKINQKKFKKGLPFSCELKASDELLEEFISSIGFRREGDTISKTMTDQDYMYLRGGWLEERVYIALRSVLGQTGDVQLGVQIRGPQQTKNEIDVLFTRENVLHLVECKSLGAAEGGEQELGGTVTSFIYKLAALRQEFGLTPRGYLATTAEEVLEKDGTVKEHLKKRAEQFNICIIPLLNTPDLEGYFAGLFK